MNAYTVRRVALVVVTYLLVNLPADIVHDWIPWWVGGPIWLVSAYVSSIAAMNVWYWSRIEPADEEKMHG